MDPKTYIERDEQYSPHIYHPIPVVLQKGEGIYVWDVEGKRYMDFLSGYSALSQGHCHPKIIEALNKQASLITLTSRAFHNDLFADYCEYLTKMFGYDKALPMNTGAEAVETALKLARRWGYVKKRIEDGKAQIVACDGNFHGRTITVISMSSDPDSYSGFGPLTPGIIRIPYNNVDALREVFENNKDIAGFLVEPIQGEAGIYIPDDGYLKTCYDLCKEYNVLFIADEIQTGLGRTGKMLCCDWDGIRPDIVTLAKALSGGVVPSSAVLGDDEVMLCVNYGEHGSTYGGNPLAARVSMAALKVIEDEGLVENSLAMGEMLREQLNTISSPFVEQIRGRGLLNAIVIKDNNKISAWDICIKMADRGLLAKPTHDTIIRFAPPLIINKEQIIEAANIIKEVIEGI